MPSLSSQHSTSAVTFFCGSPKELEVISKLDVDVDWEHFGSRIRDWIGGTYLRLRAAGHPVTISADLPEKGMVVCHVSELDTLREHLRRRPLRRLVVVGIRGDKRPAPQADFEVVQNAASADGERSHFIPFWPQPGLLARDPGRGTRVDAVSFKGYAGNMHPDLGSQRWLEAMASHGFSWDADAPDWQGVGVSYAMNWHDYRSVDAVVALRPRLDDAYIRKPASKLVNAWLAGVPSVLGPEVAYRELRRSELDYLEAANADEAFEHLLRLRREPQLYRAMVDHGHRRAREFTVEATTRRWAQLLFEDLPARLRGPGRRATLLTPAGVRLKARSGRSRAQRDL